MRASVIVLGAGGHAKVLINALQLCSVEILGITDPDPGLIGQKILGVPVIGSDGELRKYSAEDVQLVNGLGSTRLPSARQSLFEKFTKRGYRFATVIHPAAVIAADVVIDEGAQIMAGAVVQPGVRIGANTIINTRASVDHDCRIGAHVHIAPGVTLSGGVEVGDNSHVGTGATVIQGVSIGRDCLIGAGSLVLRDIPEKVKAVGRPAKVISE